MIFCTFISGTVISFKKYILENPNNYKIALSDMFYYNIVYNNKTAGINWNFKLKVEQIWLCIHADVVEFIKRWGVCIFVGMNTTAYIDKYKGKL